MEEFVTSDFHFNDEKMLKQDFCTKRNIFSNLTEMEEEIIKRHNNVVTDDDITYILGDISVGGDCAKTYRSLTKMNGQLVVIKGNHDKNKLFNYIEKYNYRLSDGRMKFIIEPFGKMLKVDNISIQLSHHPILDKNLRTHMRNICGHLHEEPSRVASSLNVGLDSPEIPKGHPFGEPLRLKKVLRLITEKRKRYYKNLPREKERLK